MNLESFATVRAAVVLALACAATPAFSSANLIQNGDFSTDNLSNWHIEFHNSTVVNGAILWNTPFKYGFSQMFETTIGTHYKIEFQLESTNNEQGYHQILWNNRSLIWSASSPFAVTDFSFTQTADTELSTLTFDINPGNGAYTLDNVSVVALSPVPELETAPMLVFGMALLAAMARRRQTKAIEASNSHST
ncbi:hypothetical protein [Xylophilus sp. GOD-11R]|uniref:hypothetical protein n=1 Tax=Xylophilus sp. GOD-11R TaxID=3089814 RepID=UPI00298D412A|nr:hypothetical protein [Xylophilus sp. GOD-11R]WPB57095.1 hypothetical protein R9X41_00055 [Xylophilus sp. GOD-11R]